MKKIFRVESLRYQIAYCYVAAETLEDACRVMEKKTEEKDNRIILEADLSDWDCVDAKEVSGVDEDEAIRINALYIDGDDVGFTEIKDLSEEPEEKDFDVVLKKALKTRVIYQPQNGIYLPESSYTNPLIHACCGSHSGKHRRHCTSPDAIEDRKKLSEQAKEYHKTKSLTV